MAIKLEGKRRPYEPKDSDKVECEEHGIVTTWGELSPIQRFAVEEGIDTVPDRSSLPSVAGELSALLKPPAFGDDDGNKQIHLRSWANAS